MKQSLKVLDEYAESLITERRSDPKLEEKDDLLSTYIINTKEDNKYLR
jgi:cytochrome P450